MSEKRNPKNSDHVVDHDGSKGFFGFECLRCKTRQAMARPVALDVMAAAGKAFLGLHTGCKVPAAKVRPSP